MRYLLYAVGLIGVLAAASGRAHEGVLDSYGCHRNVAHGSYHCHSGLLADRQYKTREQMLRAYKEREQEQQQRLRRPGQVSSGG
jgi:hypothetical protein